LDATCAFGTRKFQVFPCRRQVRVIQAPSPATRASAGKKKKEEIASSYRLSSVRCTRVTRQPWPSHYNLVYLVHPAAFVLFEARIFVIFGMSCPCHGQTKWGLGSTVGVGITANATACANYPVCKSQQYPSRPNGTSDLRDLADDNRHRNTVTVKVGHRFDVPPGVKKHTRQIQCKYRT
jgi:hypothetical protein